MMFTPWELLQHMRLAYNNYQEPWMPYNPNLQLDRAPTPRQVQAERYDNLANFLSRVMTLRGRAQYPEAGIRRQLVARHVLNRDGSVNENRLNRYLTSLGHRKLANSMSDVGWEDVVEGESPE